MRNGLAATALTILAVSFTLSARAADFDGAGALAQPVDGVACPFEDWGPAIDLPWASVWLGHFAGGRFLRTAAGPLLDWRDQKMCFPSRLACDRWIQAQKAAFHRPEGDWTCLPIR
jgi:hypothetical protein